MLLSIFWRQERFFPPLAENPGTQALAAQAEAIYAGLGKTITLISLHLHRQRQPGGREQFLVDAG